MLPYLTVILSLSTTLGSGSIMDPRGKCLLLISSTPISPIPGSGSGSGGDSSIPSQRVAKVMNKGNQVVAVYTQDNNNGDSSGYGSGYGGGSGSKMDPHGNVQHSWRFDGLHMSFDPHTFEIKVRRG